MKDPIEDHYTINMQTHYTIQYRSGSSLWISGIPKIRYYLTIEEARTAIEKAFKEGFKGGVDIDEAAIIEWKKTSVLVKKNHQMALQKQIKEYIKNGSKGDLYLSNTPITSLPEGLTVGSSLYLSNTPITSLPEGLTVGGNLDLINTPITSLPEGLTVGSSLYLINTPITSLPEGLTVGGILDLSNTQITSLPEGLTVGSSLYLINTPISKQYSVEQLKQMLPNVNGTIYI